MSNKMRPIDTGEQQKIMKLQSEKSNNDNLKVEWLYTGDKIDRDAYLLGKPIDKLLVEKEIDKPKESVFSETIDLANKIREDPLFEIKKRELDEKKRLLNNPMRLKQIEEQIQPRKRNNYSESDSDSGYRRKDKKNKKYSKDRNNGENSSYKKNKKNRSRSREKYYNDRSLKYYKRDYSSDSSSDEKHKKYQKKDKLIFKSRSRSPSNDKYYKHKEKAGYGLIEKNSSHYQKTNERFKSTKHQEIEEIKQKIEKIKQIRKSQTAKEVTKIEKYNNKIKPKMSNEEKQKRLAEMQDNAKWHENIRSKNIKNYKNEDELEKKLNAESTTEKSKSQASHMFNKMMHDAYGSAEDRIKRNKKSLQNNDASFNNNFARK